MEVAKNLIITLLLTFVDLPCSYPNLSNKMMCISWEKNRGARTFVDKIYKKYGKEGMIDRKGYAELLKSLGLGTVIVKCQPDDDECLEDKLNFHSMAIDGTKISRRKKRAVDLDHDDDEAELLREHEEHWKNHIRNCFRSDALLSLNAVNISDGLSEAEFMRMCPSLIQQIDMKMCIHQHQKMEHHSHLPSPAETWGYGFASITVISLLSLSVIAVIPCLKKSYYIMVMAFLVALAVGTLAGDAMLHLIPHAFVEGANTATNATMSEADQLRQHYSQVWRALFVLLGLYVFFVVEQLMKLKALCGVKSGDSDEGEKSETPIMSKKIPQNDDDCLEDVKFEMKPVPFEHSLSCTSDIHNDHNHEVPDEGHFHADDRHHHHHHQHSEKVITKETKIASVAWMVIVGDGFHNFSDGLAVGAAFSASLSSGISTAIAVFCHELPHELGDFAILVKSGMTVRQAIVYNLVSAVLAYIGLVIGIFAGSNELGRHFILSITAGMFLYVSLADMLPELTHQDIPKSSRCATFICQHLGILTGIGMMLVISLYEHDM